ncbi:MAG: hypothetical protein HY253_05530 [Burkholderiales bacterium]|nr:hypothetical protein [Burkholderiales bacterium]
MNPAIFELPTGAALEHEIEAIELSIQDEHIRQIIAQRVVIADSGKATLCHMMKFLRCLVPASLRG